MTVEQMTFYSKMFLVLMFAFLIAAAAMYFLLEIRKAWQIVVGTKISVPIGRNRNTEEMRRNVKSKELSGDRSGQVSSRVRTKKKRNAAPKYDSTAFKMAAVPESGTLPFGTETAILEPETAVLGQESEMRPTVLEHGGTAVLGVAEANRTTLLKKPTKEDSMLDMVMDITFVHTSVTV